MDEKRRQQIQLGFDAASEGYDRPALRFFRDSARLQAEHMDLAGSERLLDLATGTGALALEAARRLPNGRVTGVDLSPGMLAQARSKAEAAGASNVDFREMDITALDFPDHGFDAAGCAFGIFFVEDMAGQLRHLASKLVPGGRVTLSGFGQGLFHPMVDRFLERIEAYGVEVPPMSWQRVDAEDKFAALFEEAGLRDFRFERHDIGYRVDGPEQWWDIIRFAGFRGLIAQLSAEELNRFKREHLDEVAPLAERNGLHLPIETLYASAATPPGD